MPGKAASTALYNLDFHAAAYHQRLEDTEGSELADPEAAHHEAMDSAIDLICDRLKGGWFQNGQKIFGSSIEVTDESGVSLLTFPFTEIISRGQRQFLVRG